MVVGMGINYSRQQYDDVTTSERVSTSGVIKNQVAGTAVIIATVVSPIVKVWVTRFMRQKYRDASNTSIHQRSSTCQAIEAITMIVLTATTVVIVSIRNMTNYPATADSSNVRLDKWPCEWQDKAHRTRNDSKIRNRNSNVQRHFLK